MLLSKKKRREYLGFDDFWFIVIGCIVLSFVTDYLFNGCSFLRYPFHEAIVNYGISLFFCMCNWFIMRGMLIFVRRKFPEFKDNLKRIIIFLLVIVASILLVDLVGNYILAYGFGDSYHPGDKSFILIPVFIISIMTMAIYEAIYFYQKLRVSVREEEQAKQIIVQAKLDALRNQAQPHFLFNSLNTLRDIIDQDSKEDAKQFVNKLSDVYRFILESSNANLITLREEVKFAKSYMHIQSERFGANLIVEWEIEEVALDKMVVPMSLQLLLENAIKHNVISRSTPLKINVTAKADKLLVENKIQPKSTKIASTKLGLKNIEKRYALISDGAIEIDSSGDIFSVSLTLLNSSIKTKNYEHTDH